MNKLITIFLIGFLSISCSQTSDNPEGDINLLLNNWHLAAAEANFDLFFNSMDENAIFLGTQADERWTKSEFMDFSKPYFDKGKAWDFKPFDRTLYNSEDGYIAWFEESLETWMGVCRGSGVVAKIDNDWKIIHYNLAVTISNDLVGEFIEVIKQDTINNFLKN